MVQRFNIHTPIITQLHPGELFVQFRRTPEPWLTPDALRAWYRNASVYLFLPMEFLWNFYEFLWIYLWISMDFYEFLWISMDCYEFLWISTESLESNGKWMIGSNGILWEIHWNLWISGMDPMESYGKSSGNPALRIDWLVSRYPVEVAWCKTKGIDIMILGKL